MFAKVLEQRNKKKKKEKNNHLSRRRLLMAIKKTIMSVYLTCSVRVV